MEGLEAERAAVEALRRSTARREEQLEADRRAIEAEAIPERDEESALRGLGALEPEPEREPEPEPEPEPDHEREKMNYVDLDYKDELTASLRPFADWVHDVSSQRMPSSALPSVLAASCAAGCAGEPADRGAVRVPARQVGPPARAPRCPPCCPRPQRAGLTSRMLCVQRAQPAGECAHAAREHPLPPAARAQARRR